MPDIIKLLPDSIANQIAAGEVIQRPASVVKEMLENAVDAGASQIDLVVKDAGKTLIQISDNGCGMSETDARLSFERHATSKIKTAGDLFNINTFGFRGEALASIASIAHVELKTKRVEDELGSRLIIEGSAIKTQEPVAMVAGTVFSVKNLFYNTPARRNFLKTESVELKHIIDEFIRVALSHPEIGLTLCHNDTDVFHLPKTNLKQRIVAILGENYLSQLVPIAETTAIVTINGFVGKPQVARKSRGNQYFFVNNRFIRDGYLHHAVMNAYQELLQAGYYPAYVVYFSIDPAKIDINIHPTKTEVKFEEERNIYSILFTTIKRALSQYQVAPSFDFETEQKVFEAKPVAEKPAKEFSFSGSNFNLGSKTDFGNNKNASSLEVLLKTVGQYNPAQNTEVIQPEIPMPQHPDANDFHDHRPVFQLHDRYIIAQIKSGLMLIDQQLAHERILFERFMLKFEQAVGVSQQNLFPEIISLGYKERMLMAELKEDITRLGFDISENERGEIEVHGSPADVDFGNAKTFLLDLMDQYQNNAEFKQERKTGMAKYFAKLTAVKYGKTLSVHEMNAIIDTLFACSNPSYTPDGKPIVVTLNMAYLEKLFK